MMKKEKIVYMENMSLMEHKYQIYALKVQNLIQMHIMDSNVMHKQEEMKMAQDPEDNS